MSERRRGSLYVLATRRPWAEVSHNFFQRRRRPARPACPKKGSRRAPARPPPYIAAPTPRYARRRRERPVGHEAEGMSSGVPAQSQDAPPVARCTHKARPTPPLSSHLSASRRRRMDSAHLTPSKRRSRRWRDRAPRRHRRGAVGATPSRRHRRKTPPKRRSTRPSTCKTPRPGPTRMI